MSRCTKAIPGKKEGVVGAGRYRSPRSAIPLTRAKFRWNVTLNVNLYTCVLRFPTLDDRRLNWPQDEKCEMTLDSTKPTCPRNIPTAKTLGCDDGPTVRYWYAQYNFHSTFVIFWNSALHSMPSSVDDAEIPRQK